MSDVPNSPDVGAVGTAAPVLGQRYQLVQRLATGGMGAVWSATDLVLGRTVAVKVLRDDLVDSSTFLERFRNEARHTASLAHPGIAGVYDYGEDRIDGTVRAYLVMELVPGSALSEVMFDHGPFDTTTTLSVLAQAGEALHAAHSVGIVHRDVKPGNLMVLDDGSIKLTDFGIARAADGVAITEVGQVVGTAQYMAPEQAMGEDATASSDVYSLGVIGYEMLAGRPPFTGANPAALALAHVHQAPPPLPATVPAGVTALIETAMAKDPARRPADASAFAAAARRLLLDHLPPPMTVATSDGSAPHGGYDAAGTPTALMDGAARATAVMPAGGVAVGAPRLEVAAASLSPRRRIGRWWLLGALVVVLLGAAAAVSRSSDDAFHAPTGATTTAPAPPSSATTTPTAPATTTPVAVAPAVLVSQPPATTVPAAPAGGKGKGNGNGKGRGGGKG